MALNKLQLSVKEHDGTEVDHRSGKEPGENRQPEKIRFKNMGQCASKRPNLTIASL